MMKSIIVAASTAQVASLRLENCVWTGNLDFDKFCGLNDAPVWAISDKDGKCTAMWKAEICVDPVTGEDRYCQKKNHVNSGNDCEDNDNRAFVDGVCYTSWRRGSKYENRCEGVDGKSQNNYCGSNPNVPSIWKERCEACPNEQGHSRHCDPVFASHSDENQFVGEYGNYDTLPTVDQNKAQVDWMCKHGTSPKANFRNLCPDAKEDYLTEFCNLFLKGVEPRDADSDGLCYWSKFYPLLA